MHRGFIALSAAIVFAFVAAVAASASNHTSRKHRRAASAVSWKRATPERKPAPLDAVLEEHKKADPASPAPALDVSVTPVILQQPLLHKVVLDTRLSPHSLASVLLL